jgi:hypothetical protein
MSLAETKIITEQEVKNWTDISNNVQSSSLACFRGKALRGVSRSSS